MRSSIVVVATVVLAATSGVCSAQTDRQFTPLELAAGCAPPPTLDGVPNGAPRVIGSQDTVPRRLFGSRDLLVVDAGTKGGMELGQQFFVRRQSRYAMAPDAKGRSATTVGWVRVVAVNESTSIAVVEQACGGIIQGDYLEKFEPPVLPANMTADDRAGEPDFSELARIVIGNEDRISVGIGDFTLIDRGSEHGLTAGARFSVYRDVGVAGMPLASVGEGIVVATGEAVSVTRITRARDAVISGDYVAIRK